MNKHGKKLLCASILCGLGLAGLAHAQNDTAAAAPPQDSNAAANSGDKSKTPQQRAQEKQAQNLQQVTVTGYRESLAKAIEIKRNANAIVDAINAEDIGKFPDTNAAESLSHLPGISVDRQFGEGEKVSINGTDPALNRVLLNGQTIASGDWGGNPTDTSGRTFNYTLLSPEIISNMQVYKSPEAHIDEGSIGGTVIVNTRKPLDLPANTLRGSLGYSYNDRSKEGNPRGSVLWSWKNSDSTFGFLTSLTHDKEDLSRAGIEFFGYTNGAGITSNPTVSGSGDLATAKLPVGINSSYFQQTRKRDGIQSALQWRPDDKNEFNLTGIYVKGEYNNFSQSEYVCPGCGDLNKITNVTMANGYITKGTVSAATGNGQPYAELDTNYRESTVKTRSINLRHDYSGDKWVLTSQVGYTSASGGKNPEYLMKYLLNSGGYNFAYDGKSTNVTYDNNDPNNWGLKATPAGLPAGSTSGMQAGGIYYSVSKDRERYAQFDASRDLDWGPIYQVQMGLKYINHFNGQSSYGNRINTTDAVLLSDFDTISTPNGLWDGLGASGDLTHWTSASKSAVLDYLRGLPQGAYNIDYGQSFGVKEITKDAYVQFNYHTDYGLRGNFGVRYADTTDKSTYWQSLNGGPQQLVTAKQDYKKPLPTFNLIYDVDDDKVLRYSMAKVIARPRYADLAGAFTRDDITLTASGGNPKLKPYESTNFDLAGEWYFKPGSMLGTEVFYRKIDSYAVTTTSDQQLLGSDGLTHTYSVSSPINASNAKVTGVSLMYQQDFGYGFGLQANYTWAHASTSNGLNMPYLSKNTSNIIPYYEHGPWSARVVYSWRSPYFTQVGRLNSDVFSDQYKELDFTVGYQVNQWMGVTLSATNLLDSTYYWYNGVKYAPIGMYKNGRTLAVGVNFKL